MYIIFISLPLCPKYSDSISHIYQIIHVVYLHRISWCIRYKILPLTRQKVQKILGYTLSCWDLISRRPVLTGHRRINNRREISLISCILFLSHEVCYISWETNEKSMFLLVTIDISTYTAIRCRIRRLQSTHSSALEMISHWRQFHS